MPGNEGFLGPACGRLAMETRDDLECQGMLDVAGIAACRYIAALFPR